MEDYFEKIKHSCFHDNQNIFFVIRLLVGHGDGKGPGDMGYKRMKKVFTNHSQNGFLDGFIRYWSPVGVSFSEKQIDFR
jgi:hypothetical protein